MSRHHAERQQPDTPQSLPPSTDPGLANQPVPPSFDPALANSPPPAPGGDQDSAKAAKSPPAPTPAPDPTGPAVDPLSPPATPTDPNNSSSPPKSPADHPPSPPPATSTTLPSADHSKHPSDPTTPPHDGTAPVDPPLPGPPASSSPPPAAPQAPESPAPPSPSPPQTSTSSPPTPPASNTTTTATNKHPNSSTPAQVDLPPSQPVAGAINPSTLDQTVAAKSPDSSASHAAHPQQNSRSDESTGTHVGTIMGILLAAVVGALILVGVLGMIKRKRKARQNEADFHHDIFQEKNSFEPDMDRKSLGSASLGMPMSPDGNRNFNPRADGIFAPRPPSIIERHQASPAIPGPMPSYQPGQVLNYSPYPTQQQQSFNLHRPKPPTYHCGFPEKSGLAYTKNGPIERSLSPRLAPHDQNNVVLEMSHQDSSSPNQYDYQGAGQHIPMQNMMGYGNGGGVAGGGGPTYPGNEGVASLTPNYQQQVDQLDFLGQPSPALTIVGPLTTDWGQSCEPAEQKLLSPVPVTPSAPATSLPLEEDRSGTPMIANLQQSYLDCDSRLSERTPLDHPHIRPGSDQHPEDWKLASPNLASPLGEIFKDDAYLGSPSADHLHLHPSTIDADRASSHSPLKVINP